MLAVYFLLSIAASAWVRVRGAGRGSRVGGRESARRSGWGRWLLTMPDTVVVFLASPALSVWDRARTTGGGRHGRRRIGAAPEAALGTHGSRLPAPGSRLPAPGSRAGKVRAREAFQGWRSWSGLLAMPHGTEAHSWAASHREYP
ncbi:hypothetical protein OG426_03485 [Streptomyces canus]|uniref:hypothetical protein n=1 Tax=Streptomyces canus TaxID=58343 RepID=UPI00386C1D3B|nr:hypothetical protein OG426_03485 [Streptomyces canus]